MIGRQSRLSRSLAGSSLLTKSDCRECSAMGMVRTRQCAFEVPPDGKAHLAHSRADEI